MAIILPPKVEEVFESVMEGAKREYPVAQVSLISFLVFIVITIALTIMITIVNITIIMTIISITKKQWKRV